MRYGSVCSGIEAATAAWHPLGWRPSFFSEIEAFPRAVLAHHYPDVPLHGDFTTIEADQYEPIDLLVGGTPCQSFSVAGLRGGLDDDRGNLALEYLRLADRLRPRWLVWENVPGVLSSNGGRDFGAILGGMVELGYGVAYRVLDAQFFGLAQRRKRVFVVGYLGDWRRAAAVLFERHSLSGNPAPRREAGQKPAPTISARPTGGGGLGTDFDLDGGLIATPLLDGAKGRTDKRGSRDGAAVGNPGDPMFTLREGSSHAVAVHAIQAGALRENASSGPDGLGVQSDHAYTLEARADLIAELVARETGEPWVIWCDTDYEADALADRIPGAVEVRGSMTPDAKEARITAFSAGEARVIITKPSVAGFGLNWQHCARMAFVGLSFSYESFYQAVRRCYRFGQARPVDVHVACADTEEAIWNVVNRKAGDHDTMKLEMTAAMKRAVLIVHEQAGYAPARPLQLPTWLNA